MSHASEYDLLALKLRMKIASILLLLAGWGLVLASIVLLSSPGLKTGFVLAGVAVQLLGLVLLFRSNLLVRGERG